VLLLRLRECCCCHAAPPLEFSFELVVGTQQPEKAEETQQGHSLLPVAESERIPLPPEYSNALDALLASVRPSDLHKGSNTYAACGWAVGRHTA